MDQVNSGETAPKKKKVKVLRPSQIVNKDRDIYPFKDKFFDSFGMPEKHVKWFITGPPYSGKSSFVFELCNYLTQFGIVDYNNHEEAGGDSDTVSEKIIQSGMGDKDGKVRLFKAPIESDDYETYFERLNKRKSADFGVLDSVQHAELSKKQYLHLTDSLCNTRKKKSLIFISHGVKTDYTKFIKHDCDIKIEVIGFIAHVESRCRFAKNKPFVIWEKAAREHWGKKYHRVTQGKYWPGIKK